MKLSGPIRALFGTVAIVALLIGVFMWGAPPEFSGAQVGDAMECEAGACRIIDVDESQWGKTIEDFSDLPRTVLFEGTEAEAQEWTRQRHVEATRSVAIGWFAGAVVLGGLALFPGRRREDSTG